MAVANIFVVSIADRTCFLLSVNFLVPFFLRSQSITLLVFILRSKISLEFFCFIRSPLFYYYPAPFNTLYAVCLSTTGEHLFRNIEQSLSGYQSQEKE